MRRTLILAAAVSGLAVASSAFAAFTVTAQPATVAGLGAGLSAFDLFALNDGVATGTKLQAAAISYNSLDGKKAYFNVLDNDDGEGNGPDGIPDTAFLYNFGTGAVATLSSIRVSSTVANGGAAANPTMSYAGGSPAGFDGTFTQPNPWVGGRSQFSADYAALSSAAAAPATTGFGARFARLIVDTAGTAVVTGNVGGDVGVAQPFTLNLGGTGPVNTAPVYGVASSATGTGVSLAPGATDTTATVTVDFGNAYSTRAFTVLVPITDDVALSGLTLSSNAAALTSAGLSGVSLSIVGTNVQISGNLARTVPGTLLVGPLVVTATDAGGLSDVYNVNFNAVPEPTTLAGLAGVALLGLRRRK